VAGVAPGESHPVARGRLCSRGWNAHEASFWGGRVLHPLVRQCGDVEKVSWVAALDHVEAKLRDLLRAGKPIGVLGSARATNEENYLAGRLARAALGTNHIDFCHHATFRPVLLGIEDVTGDSSLAIRLADIESSDAIVLIEGDLTSTHPRAASAVLQALTKGARLIVIGCARTQMARVASCFLEAAPGHEGDVLNGLLAAALALGSCVAHTSLERDLRETKPTDEMRAAAPWIAARRAVFLTGPTSGSAAQIRSNAAALASLAAITGHLGQPGSGLLPLLGRSNVRGACDMGIAPDRLPGYERIENADARRRLERVWRKAVPAAGGLDAEKMIESVSGLIVLADNPEAVLPFGERARAALERIQFLVALDAFTTPLGRFAHVVLPVASYAETAGTVTNIEGRIQKVRPAAAPPGEAREGWEVLAALCARFEGRVSWASAADVYREIGEAAPRYRTATSVGADEGWESRLPPQPEQVHGTPQAAAAAGLARAERPYVLARDGAFDWSDDPLIAASPTLNREYQSTRKLFPNGFVEMNRADADALGVRTGWQVKLTSVHGEAILPVQLRSGLRRGILLVPYGFRDKVCNVLYEDGATAVAVERT